LKRHPEQSFNFFSFFQYLHTNIQSTIALKLFACCLEHLRELERFQQPSLLSQRLRPNQCRGWTAKLAGGSPR